MQTLICTMIAVMILAVSAAAAEDPADWVFGQPVLLGTGFATPEGPTLDTDGNLYFCEYGSPRIIKIVPDTFDVSVFAEVGVQNNGLIIDRNGDFFVGDWMGKAVYTLSKNGTSKLLTDKNPEGDPFLGPNDYAWHKNGRLYMTDPKGSDHDNLVGRVYFFDSERKVHTAAGELAFPNGLAFSPDYSYLYVGETKMNRVLRFTIDDDGTLADKTVFYEMGESVWPDGMKCDVEGNLWVTAWTEKEVWCINPAGERIATLRIPGRQPRPTNILFCGPDWKTAYVTINEGADGRVYSIEMPVAGYDVIPR